MGMLERLLYEDLLTWENTIREYEDANVVLKVPSENSPSTLHSFNINVNELYTKVIHDFARARRNKDAIQRLIKTVLEDYYKGSNEQARKAAGIQLARVFPTPENYPVQTVNLFDLEDAFNGIFYALEATVKSLQAKADAKITSNSLLNIEKSLVC
ncbi:hypothetical protein [Bacillus cereus]|uniref:hypothetical protein n=1 Tax=Bacillus cereus TaxID=1396 RepID=UPI000330E1EF|nr:hypothetical protein [Bacillus cereus]EOO44404.1 hypothetical protein ICK_06179 [Bacillus cereus BAG1X2-2]